MIVGSGPPQAYREPMAGTPCSLPEAVQQLVEGVSSPQTFHDTFLTSRVYCEAGEEPGFVAVGSPPGGLIPIFSSEKELVVARGAVAWFSMMGADLLSLVPASYDLLLDGAGTTPVRLQLGALRQTGAISVDYT